jgi:soluble lytic murein transglycosylase
MGKQTNWMMTFGLTTAAFLPMDSFALVSPLKESSHVERISHAKELLGSSYSKSAVRATEKEKKVGPFVQSLVKKLVSKKDKKLAARISRAILSQSEKYNFDPIFLVALIQNESAFKVRQIGPVGEIGLMQVRPETAAWIAKKFKIQYNGEKDLYDPAQNIKIGMAFLSLLRKQFKKESQLYVSAYNMGARKVRLLQEEEYTPKAYVSAIMKRYVALYQGFKKKGDIEFRSKEAFQKLRKATASRKVAGEDFLAGEEEEVIPSSVKSSNSATAVNELS